jgi:hypothetical protein
MVSASTAPKETTQKLEEPQQEEIYYDSVKKRWVLRGKIYDDEDDNTTTDNSQSNSTASISKVEKKEVVNPPKPLVKPPKLTANVAPPKINKPQEGTQGIVNDENKINKISNPFAASTKKENIPKPTAKPNLANRYSSIIDT